MDINDILRHVDHTLLSQTAAWEEIRQICDDAVTYHTASVCIPPSYVRQACDYLNGKAGDLMHPESRELLEKLLRMLAEQGEEKTYRYIRREVLKKRR